MELFIKVSIAIFSIFLGHIFTRILDRARPFLIIEEFSTATKNNEQVDCTKEISNLTRKSWNTETIQEGEKNWGELEVAYKASAVILEEFDELEEKAQQISTLIENANTQDLLTDAIKEIFRNSGVQSLLEMVFLREKSGLESKEYEGEAVLNGILHPDRDGCLALVFDDSVGKMGSKLNIDVWRKDKLMPLFNAMQHHDKEALLEALNVIQPFAMEQRDVHTKLKEELVPLREKETIWVAKCSIINYGKAPAIIHPTAKITIINNDGKKLKPIDCYVATKDDEKNDATDMVGPNILAPNAELGVWIITKEKKGNITDGNQIDGLFKDKNSTAFVSIDINQPYFSIINKVKSKVAIFQEND